MYECVTHVLPKLRILLALKLQVFVFSFAESYDCDIYKAVVVAQPSIIIVNDIPCIFDLRAIILWCLR